jgi:hypothetical protein
MALASKAARHGCAYQRALLEKNKKYVVDPPTIERCQELSKQLFYTRLARSAQPMSSCSLVPSDNLVLDCVLLDLT